MIPMNTTTSFQSSSSRHRSSDNFGAIRHGSRSFGFNPLHRGIGLLTRRIAGIALILALGFNPLHRGIGLLTSREAGDNAQGIRFQSSSSRHRSSDVAIWYVVPEGKKFQSSSSRHRSSDLDDKQKSLGILLKFQSSSSRHRSSDSSFIKRPRRTA